MDAITAGQTDPDEPGAEPREYALPRGVHVNMQEGERVRAGEPLMDGPSNPHDILNVLGEKALQSYLSTIDGARGFSRAIKRAAVERSPPFLFVGSRNIFHTMTAEDRALLDVFAKRVRLVVPSAAIWAFGSRARGSPEPDSDLDLCVVVPDVTREVREAIHDIAWEIGFEHGRLLAPVILSADDYERGPMSASTLVANIRRDGVAA